MDSFGSVQSMRHWASVCLMAPYYVAVVEIALSETPGLVRNFGIVGGSQDRRHGSDGVDQIHGGA